MESWALIFLRLRVMAHGVVWWADAFPWKRWWCLAMIVVVSCCNLFLVARSAFLVWLWHFVLIVSPVACVRFSFHVWHLLQFVSRCAYFTIELLCVSRLNLAFVALVFLLRAQRFSFRVSRERFAFRVSCFRVSRFTLTFVICFSLRVFQDLISQWSGWEGNWTVTRFSSHSVAFVARVSCYVFRVSRFTLAFVAIFFSLRVCVSRFTLAFDDDQKLCKMDFQRVVQDGVQECKSRWCARW